jgi:hypothetical protein
MLHERHRASAVMANAMIAWLRVSAARLFGAGPYRLAREERRYAVALGMLDGLRNVASREAPVPPL